MQLLSEMHRLPLQAKSPYPYYQRNKLFVIRIDFVYGECKEGAEQITTISDVSFDEHNFREGV